MSLIIHAKVESFITSLEKSTQAKWTRQLSLLELYGKNLGMPHVRRVTPTLSELRIRGNQEVRALFTLKDDQIAILHAFIKKAQKTPQREIDVAEKRIQLLT